MARWVAGVDGCKKGWIVALRDLEAPGRIVVTAHNIYRSLSPDFVPTDVMTLFTQMAQYEATLAT